jgi:hypothetical protein
MDTGWDTTISGDLHTGGHQPWRLKKHVADERPEHVSQRQTGLSEHKITCWFRIYMPECRLILGQTLRNDANQRTEYRHEVERLVLVPLCKTSLNLNTIQMSALLCCVRRASLQTPHRALHQASARLMNLNVYFGSQTGTGSFDD